MAEGLLPEPVADPVPEDGIGSVEVTTAEVAETELVAVPTSTVKYMPATGPVRFVDET